MKTPFYRYLITLLAVAAAGSAAWKLAGKYARDPWTRDCQVRANVVGLAPRVSGPITNIRVHDNQVVRAGDLLFEVDAAEYQTALDAARGAVANAEVNLRQKQQDLDRQRELFARQVNSKEDLQNSQNASEAARAQLTSARANLVRAELNLGYTKVFAPVDGYLTNFNVSPGTYVHVGDQVLALVDAHSFWVAAYFKETQLPAVQPGRRVRITLMGYPDQDFGGVVDSVAWGIYLTDGAGSNGTGLLPAVNQTVDWVRLPQRFPVRVRIEGRVPLPLRVGQTVSVALRSDAVPE